MKLIVFALLCISCLGGKAQNSYLAKEDIRVAKLFEKAFDDKHLDRQMIADKWQPMLESELKLLLNSPSSHEFPFPELSKQISIFHSPDKVIRVFTWNTMLGGSVQDICCIIQYARPSGQAQVNNIYDLKAEYDIDGSVSYDSIIKLDSTTYLFRGYGRYGSMNSTVSFSVFRVDNDTLHAVGMAFETVVYNAPKFYEHILHINYTPDIPFIEMVVEGDEKIIPNMDSINKHYKPIYTYANICNLTNYNPTTHLLSYPEITYGDDGMTFNGFTGKMLHLHYNGQVFTRKEE